MTGRDVRLWGFAAASGLLAAAALLGFYLATLSAVSGWEFTAEQFGEFWPFIVALSGGFGIQVGLVVWAHRAAHHRAHGKVVATTGTVSGAAMISCCAHYLVNFLPVLGATGLVGLVAEYQVQFFWFGLAANLAGIAYVGSRVLRPV